MKTWRSATRIHRMRASVNIQQRFSAQTTPELAVQRGLYVTPIVDGFLIELGSTPRDNRRNIISAGRYPAGTARMCRSSPADQAVLTANRSLLGVEATKPRNMQTTCGCLLALTGSLPYSHICANQNRDMRTFQNGSRTSFKERRVTRRVLRKSISSDPAIFKQRDGHVVSLRSFLLTLRAYCSGGEGTSKKSSRS